MDKTANAPTASVTTVLVSGTQSDGALTGLAMTLDLHPVYCMACICWNGGGGGDGEGERSAACSKTTVAPLCAHALTYLAMAKLM